MPEERAQRRLAAILDADVVGYSRLMGVSEAGTLAALTRDFQSGQASLRPTQNSRSDQRTLGFGRVRW